MKNNMMNLGRLLVILVLFTGCTASRRGNEGQMNFYPLMANEAKWIVNGEPIEYEGEQWYPQDGIETLLDSEVIYLGEYRDVQFFTDRIDVRPYQRLYTKFGKYKFRYFAKREQAQ